MRVDLHRHTEVRMTEQLLRGLDVDVCVIEHGCVTMPQLMRSERLHGNNLGIDSAAVFAACLNVQIVHIASPRLTVRLCAHDSAGRHVRANIQ